MARPPARLPLSEIATWRRTFRYAVAVTVSVVLTRYVRLSVEGRERVPPGAVVYCWSHASWTDPLMVMAALPKRPWLYFLGPAERDMAIGERNRLLAFFGNNLPFSPDRRRMVEVIRTARLLLASGRSLGVAAEGRLHTRENDLLPFDEGAAHFALRSGAPLVPVTILGTTWIGFMRRVRVVIGEPIPMADLDPADRRAPVVLTERLWNAMYAVVADAPPREPSRGLGRRISLLFNDWGPMSRDEADADREAEIAAHGRMPVKPSVLAALEAQTAGRGAGSRGRGSREAAERPEEPAAGPDLVERAGTMRPTLGEAGSD